MQVTFITPPRGGEITPQILSGVLGKRGVILPLDALGTLTANERMIAYDWAMREHLSATMEAGHPRPERPRFLDLMRKA
jgi:hypothetical protein